MAQIPSALPPTPRPKTDATPEGYAKVPEAGFKTKPMTFLGMHFDAKEAAQLWQSIIQSVNSQIQKNKEKSVKAIRNMGKDEDEKE